MYCVLLLFVFFFFKQKTAYEMRISDWSSDVCSSDLQADGGRVDRFGLARLVPQALRPGASVDTFSPIGLLWAFIGAVVLLGIKIGRASCRERVCQYV